MTRLSRTSISRFYTECLRSLVEGMEMLVASDGKE